MDSRELIKQAEDLQAGNCKLVFYPRTQQAKSSDQIGFKTFTEMMKTNVTWISRVDELQSPRKENAYGQKELEKQLDFEFPSYLNNRLKFNKVQVENFKDIMDEKWKDMFEAVKTNYQQRQHQGIKQPQVKLIQVDKKKDNENDNIEEEAEQDLGDQDNIRLKNFKLFWYQVSITEQWKPPNREGCTLSQLEGTTKCIVYGGIGRDLFNTFITLNTKNWSWQDIGPGNGESPIDGRFGHSVIIYKRNILIYGGERKYNPSMKLRECYSDVRQYCPQTHTWIYFRTYGDIVEARRNHCAVLCGKYMIVIGGVNSYGKHLSDVIALNLDSNKWGTYEVENFYPEGIAFASAICLYKCDIKMDNPYLTYEYVRRKGKKLIKLGEEGVFIFGGRLCNGQALAELRVIKMGSKPLQSYVVETKGVGPSARYMHTMNYYEPQNICIIYGGRDDNSPNESIKRDVFIFTMDTLCWVQLVTVGVPEVGKCSHSAVFIESKLIIFGGYNSHSFINSDLNIIEFEQAKVKLMIKEMKTRMMQKGKHSQQTTLVLTNENIKEDPNLRIFSMDVYSNSDYRTSNEELELNRRKMQENNRQSLTNIKTFQPIPFQEASQYVKELQLKKEENKTKRRQTKAFENPPIMSDNAVESISEVPTEEDKVE